MNCFARLMLCCGALLWFGVPAPAAYFAVPGTGTTSTGALAAGGSADVHYALVSVPAGVTNNGAFVATTTPSTIWTNATLGSQWIGMSPNLTTNYPLGSYDFRTTFSLAGFDATTATITGSVAADDNVTILLNGMSTAYNAYGHYDYLSPIALTSGFIAGTNTLDFIVHNIVDASAFGLQASLFGTATPSAVVPEPASIVLVSLGGIAALGFGLRRRRTA